MHHRDMFSRGYAQEVAYRMENAKLIERIEADLFKNQTAG